MSYSNPMHHSGPRPAPPATRDELRDALDTLTHEAFLVLDDLGEIKGARLAAATRAAIQLLLKEIEA